MNANLSDEQAKQIGAALEAGEKIGAIKLYRQFTGCDLRTAKESIEALIAGLVQREPEKYAKLGQQPGCSLVAVALVLLAIAGAVVFIFSRM